LNEKKTRGHLLHPFLPDATVIPSIVQKEKIEDPQKPLKDTPETEHANAIARHKLLWKLMRTFIPAKNFQSRFYLCPTLNILLLVLDLVSTIFLLILLVLIQYEIV
jgi:hypothetical protein